MSGLAGWASTVVFGLAAVLGSKGGGAVETMLRQESRPATTGGQDARPVTMRMLLERTIFRIDVLTLEVRIEEPTAAELRRLLRSEAGAPDAVDSLAALIADAPRAYARMDFLRDVELDRFLDAIRGSAVSAAAAGFISARTRDLVADSLPAWYGFLRGRGVVDGDRMEYFIRGDSLTVRYLSDGEGILLDRTSVGPERRRSVLGGYVARGSDFREGLVAYLLAGAGS